MTNIKNKIFFSVMLVLILLTAFIRLPQTTVFANTAIKFDNTNVLNDLQTSTVDGQEPFSILNYPYNENGTPQIINFVEYCYSFRSVLRANFGLYIYVYNPQGLNINTSAISNTIQMAVSYDNDGNATDWEKFRLQFCSMSSEPNNYRLFYKFKIIDHKSADGKKISERVNSNQRRYDVSGFELLEVGKTNPKDHKAERAFMFSGYLKGYGIDIEAETNLAVDFKEIETIQLNVKNTFYRTGFSNIGKNHQNQLDSVYFAVDNTIMDKYGELQKIKAEWYEYKTKPIVVTSLAEFYTKAQPYLGQYVTPHNDTIAHALYLNKWYGSSSSTINRFDWAWNPDDMNAQELSRENIDNTLYYLFYANVGKMESYKNYDPYGDLEEIGGVKSNKLYNYILDYKKTFTKGTLPIKNETISADLFENHVDEGRKLGHNDPLIDKADIDITKMLSYRDGDPSFWQKSKDFGFWKALFNNLDDEQIDETIIGKSPIYAVNDSDIVDGNPALTSKNLVIREQDITNFVEYRKNATSENKTTFLFRYAVTDYFSGALEIKRPSNTWHGFDEKKWKDQAYMAQETVFFDFDIIHLTFNKDGVYHVIPVVSSPIDIVNDITPPLIIDSTPDSIWNKVLAIALIVLLVVLLIALYPFLKPILLLLWNIICIPFRLISKALKFKPKQKK